MKKETEKRHSIDILFQMVIFLLFTFSAIILLILSVNFYRSIVERSDKNQNARVAVAYIREAIHQNDEQSSVTLTEFDGASCIKIMQADDYVLYLYLKDGELRELFTKEGARVTSDDGQRIMQLQRLDFYMKEDNVIIVECEDSENNYEKVLVTLKSNAGGQTS